MPVYGQFETVTELGRTGPYSTYRARAADGGWDVTFDELGSDANSVVKVLHADLILGPAAAAEEGRRFLDRVRGQRRLADGGATHWAPILDAGTTPSGDAYYAAPFYARTAATLASPASAPLDAAALYAVIAGTLDGLLELRGAQNRPHGNLRLGNVLIDLPSPAAPVTAEDVRLTDPALERDATIAGEAEDLYNLGEILYALVLRRKFNGQHTLPVRMTAEWAALGRRGADWLALCNDLLAPPADAPPLRLHDVAARVAGMATSRKMRRGRQSARARKRWLVAAAALAVVASLGAAEYAHYTRAWRDLCAAHADWLGPLADRLAKDTPRELVDDPYLNQHVVIPLADARKRGIEFSPRAIAGSEQTPAYLIEHPPMSPGAVWDTERAWYVAGKVGQSISPDHWAAATDLARRRGYYETRGWQRLTQFAAAASDAIKPAQNSDWVSAAVAAVGADKRLAALDAARDAARTRVDLLVNRAATAPALREKIGEFEAHLRQATDADAPAPTADGVDALARRIKDADTVVAQFDRLIPELADAAKLQRLYELRGWTGPARHLGALIDRAKPTAPADLAALHPAVLGDRILWEKAERTWTEIEIRRRTLEGSSDRILATYRGFVADAKLGEQPDIAALARKLDEVNGEPTWEAAAAKARGDEWAKLDPVAFAQRSVAHQKFAGRAVATQADLTQWIADVEGRGTQLASAAITPDKPPGNGAPAVAGGGTPQERDPVMTVPRPPTTSLAADSHSGDVKPPATQKGPDAVAANTADKGNNPPATQKAAVTVADAARPPVVTRPSPTTLADSGPTPPAPATQSIADAGPKPPPAATQKSPGAIAAATPTSAPHTATTLASAPPAEASRRNDLPAPNTPRPSPTAVAGAGGTSRPSYASAVGARGTPETTPPPPPPRTATQPTTVAVKPPPPPPPDPEKVRREKEIGDFVVECREVGLNAKSRDRSRELKEAWRKKNAQIADAVEKDPKLYTPALRDERSRLRGRLLQLDRAATDMAAPLAVKPGPARWNAPLVEALKTSAPRWDDAFGNLTDLAVRGDAKFDTAFEYMIHLDQEWRASAARFVADANRADQLLADGYTPDDRTTLNSSLVATLKSLRASELYQNDAVHVALEDLLGPVNVVEKETVPRSLRLLASSRDQSLGVRLAAWFKTSKDVSNQSLDEDLRVAENLLGAARERLRDKAPDRVNTIKAWLEDDLRGRWVALLQNALRSDEVAAAIAMRGRISGVDADQLPPRARVNLALYDLRAAVAGAKGSDAAAAVAPAAKRFRDAVGALEPAQQKVPAVTNVLAEIDRLEHAVPDFRQLGPMSEGATRGFRWGVAADENGDRVTYTGTPVNGGSGAGEVVLVFRRVKPADAGGRSSWVCTTETSLGVFGDLVTAAGKWPDLRAARWLPENDPARGDVRPGPRVWEWPRYGRSAEVTWTRAWLGSPGFVPARVDHYPQEIGAEFNRTQIGNPRTHEHAKELNPSERMPMQYVSAKAAQYAAALAGCRLPTVGEFLAAQRSSEQAVVGVNVRDRTWRLEMEHLARVGQRTPGQTRLRPDAGMFMPAGEQPSNEVWQQPNGAEVNDGVLWFHEVSSGASPPAVFVDLTGNVAEFVTGTSGKVYVIGASAVSPPPKVRDPNKPFEVGADQVTSGFSDVGFRLAFGEPPTGVERLRDAVAENWYLTGK